MNLESINLESINNLLSRLTVIRERYESLRLLEDQFNIFRALHKAHDERRLHSRFLSVLLSPYASHGKRDIFLRLFLERLSLRIRVEDLAVYPNESDKSEKDDMDIFLYNHVTNEAIIIENKIYAGDSNNEEHGQLEGYFDNVHTKYKVPKDNITVLYLTLNGREPSPESLGSPSSAVRDRYTCISYESTVIPWLEECIMHSATKVNLRESLIQYLKLIKDMTNHTDINERLAIRDLIAASDETMQSAKLLIDNFKHVKWHTERNFWSELEGTLVDVGCQVSSRPSDDDITFNTHYEEYKKGYKAKCYGVDFTKGALSISICTEYEYYLYWQINKIKSSPYLAKIIEIAEGEDSDWVLEEAQELAWKTFDFEEGKEIWLQNYSHAGTYNLIGADYRAKMVKSLVSEIQMCIGKITDPTDYICK